MKIYTSIIIAGFLLFSSCQSKLSSLSKKEIPNSFLNVLIDDDNTRQYKPCEPSIFINPANHDEMVAGVVLDKTFYSEDGGLSWSMNIVESSYGVYGDPVITADYEGNFYYAHLADPTGGGRSGTDWLDRIVVQKSVDGGRTWSDGSFSGHRPPADQDKHWLAVNPADNTIFMTWTEFDKYGSSDPEDHSRILFSRSEDGGITWSEEVAISDDEGNCLDGDQTTEGAVPAVGPDGQVYVAWAYDEKIYFDRSLDGGVTWQSPDIVICEQPGGWDIDIPGLGRANGMPVTSTDLSKSNYRGRIYVNFCDQKAGRDDTDVWVVHSDDQGASWSDPIRVNNDPPGKHQFFTWMSVDPATGAVYIVYYDRRNFSDNQTDVYLAYSFDGGVTFRNVKVSEKPFNPNTSVFFGDYNNISAYDGVIRPIWTRMDDNQTSIWTAIINF